jgi:cytosine permease
MQNILTFKVKDKEREGWGGLALIMAGQWVHISGLMIGGMLIEGLSFAGLLLCVAAGEAILLACVVFMSVLSCKSGLPSTALSAVGLGAQGARYISALLIGITSVGWFGVQAALWGASFSAMAAEVLGAAVPAWGAALFFGALITLSAIYGYRAVKYLFSVVTPVLFMVLLITFIHRMRFSGAVAALAAWHPVQPMSYIQGVTLIVGAWAMGTFTAGDFARYAQNPRNAAIALIAGLTPVIPAVMLSGAIFRILEGTHDISAILSAMGFPAIALVFLILAAWMINMTNAYSGGIALAVLLGLPEKRLKQTTALAGGIGTILGAVGILSRFTGFLSLLSSLVPPVIGVLAGVRLAAMPERQDGGPGELAKPAGGDPRLRPGFHFPGIIAYGAGALIAWLTGTVYPFFISPLNGIAATAAVYVLLERCFGRRQAAAGKS